MTPYERNLNAAAGHLELGLPVDANDALDDVEPELRTHSEVLAVRLQIYQTLAKWDPMEVIARQLCHQRDDEPQWAISLGYATRRAYGLERAKEVLLKGVERFPTEPILYFNLACHEAQLRNLDLARERVAEAIRLSPWCREMALKDGDLAALHEELKAGKF